ncbi:sugar phosphate isomerase/epimerase family protein [Oceanobacillus caeni]|uniref:sugar phosphate isomerase/epimerase family protein n=1 Tax=Oceanobacillus caeni TaxID=405946 RepID=UPI002E20E4C6|nr:sugar phosphate isomerase/epimerase [Oceanobacillus caeni]
MKLSLCTTGFKEWDMEEIVKWLASTQTEVKGLELWSKHIERFQEKHGPLDKLASILESYGFQIPAISAYTTFSKLWNREQHLKEMEQAKNLLDIARQLNCPRIRTFAGHIASRNASPEQWAETVTEFKKFAQIADLYDVDIAIEIHYDSFADTAESIKKLVDDINHPRIKLIYDAANLYVDQEDPIKILDSVYSHISHVHLKNYKYNLRERYKNTPAAIFDGDVDNHLILEELEKRNYEGYVSLEYFGREGFPFLRTSLSQWSQTMAAI